MTDKLPEQDQNLGPTLLLPGLGEFLSESRDEHQWKGKPACACRGLTKHLGGCDSVFGEGILLYLIPVVYGPHIASLFFCCDKVPDRSPDQTCPAVSPRWFQIQSSWQLIFTPRAAVSVTAFLSFISGTSIFVCLEQVKSRFICLSF